MFDWAAWDDAHDPDFELDTPPEPTQGLPLFQLAAAGRTRYLGQGVRGGTPRLICTAPSAPLPSGGGRSIRRATAAGAPAAHTPSPTHPLSMSSCSPCRSSNVQHCHYVLIKHGLKWTDTITSLFFQNSFKFTRGGKSAGNLGCLEKAWDVVRAGGGEGGGCEVQRGC